MPPPTGIRLRDSCQSCAASKTKCSKDKPQCARCAKRGTKCEYLVTQRTGRKALARRDSDAKEQSSDAGVRRKSLSRSTTTATSTTTTTSSSSSMYDTPDIHMSGCVEPQDGAAEMYMIEPGLETLDADTAGSMLPEMSTVHDDYFSLLLPDVDMSALDQVYDASSASATTDAAASDVLAQPLLGGTSGMPPHGTAAYAAYTQGNDVAAPGHSPRDPSPQQPDLGMLLDAACLPGQTQTGEQTAQLLSEMQMPYCQTAMHHAAASQQQQEGLTMALQLMQHLCCLSDSTSSSSSSTTIPLFGAGPQQPLRLRSLMDKCSKATATISAILHGDSSHDAYFLAIVCLTMSKVLDAYVTASRTLGAPITTDYSRRKSRSSSASSSSPSVLSSPTRPDSARSNRSSGSVSPPVVLQGDPKAVQQLLDELYHVRASMDLLGAKIAAVAPASCSVFASNLSFSAETLNRLYEEQRRRLKCISLYLINSLKAFWVEEASF